MLHNFFCANDWIRLYCFCRYFGIEKLAPLPSKSEPSIFDLPNQNAASFRPLQFCKLAELFRLGKRKNAKLELNKLEIVFSSRRPSSETTRALTFGEEVDAFTFFYVIRQQSAKIKVRASSLRSLYPS
jgi:hypothetical protein